jgi:hypothetical protein
MVPSEASKIELILGDAIQLLVESGASASITGPFALKFPAKVAQRLAVGEKPAPEQPLGSGVDREGNSRCCPKNIGGSSKIG